MLPQKRVQLVSEAKPRVAIIVLNYNGRPYVQRCLCSLFRNRYPNFEVLFVDNKSADESAELAWRLFQTEPRFTLIRNKENFGFSIGNNIGFTQAKAKYVVALNNDTEVEENFIETLVATAESDKKIGSVGCKIKQLDGRILYGPVYMNYGFIVRIRRKPSYDMFTVSLANCGCATLFRKSVIDKIGGFDPYLWTDWEDHDLGYRINIAGFRCVYTPATTVLHLGGGNYLGLSNERQIRIIRNKLYGYIKNYQAKSLLPRFPLLITMMFIGKIKHGRGIQFLQSVRRLLKMFGTLVHERKKINSLRVASDREIFSVCRIPEPQSIWESLKLS